MVQGLGFSLLRLGLRNFKDKDLGFRMNLHRMIRIWGSGFFYTEGTVAAR